MARLDSDQVAARGSETDFANDAKRGSLIAIPEPLVQRCNDRVLTLVEPTDVDRVRLGNDCGNADITNLYSMHVDQNRIADDGVGSLAGLDLSATIGPDDRHLNAGFGIVACLHKLDVRYIEVDRYA